MKSKLNDPYYNLITVLLSYLSGIESVMEKTFEVSSTASFCAECSGCLFSLLIVSGGNQRDLVGGQ